LHWRWRALPGVFIGSAGLNGYWLTRLGEPESHTWFIAATIGVGAVLGAAAGAALVHRYVGPVRRLDTPRAVSASDLAAELPENAPPHLTFDTFREALDASLIHAQPILIAGSLYLVGEAKGWLEGRAFQSCTQ
jgi:hypothetical protein